MSLKLTTKNESFCWEDNAEEKSSFRCELAVKIHILVSESNGIDQTNK